MSDVYLAVTPEDQEVALKVMARTNSMDLAHFEDQVRIYLRLRHPAVVSLKGFSRSSEEIFGQDLGPCYWMDYVTGTDLKAAANAAEPQRIFGWLREALSALRFVHAQGIVHGDLKSDNILIDASDRIRLLDFSLLPGTTEDVATLLYMAPERVLGHRPPAADLFSLGTIFYEILCGRHPRSGCCSVQELLGSRPLPLAEASPRLGPFGLEARVIDRMILADPSQRLCDAGRVLEILDRGTPVWGETGYDPPIDFEPASFIGSDGLRAAIQEGLAGSFHKSAAFALHGGSGVGKTRLVNEIRYEAALRGVGLRLFADLHRSGLEEKSSLLASLRELETTTGTIVIVEWNDDLIPAPARAFFDRLLADGTLTDVCLGPLDRSGTFSLLRGALDLPEDPREKEEVLETFFRTTAGNPGRLVEAIRSLAAGKKIRDRRLLPGWKDALITAAPEDLPPEEPVALSRFLRRRINELNALGRYREALEVCERWFALKAADEPLSLKTVKYWFVTGLNHQNLDHPAEAEGRFRRCLIEGTGHEEDPTIAVLLARARSLLGLHQLKQGFLQEALKAFEESLRSQALSAAERAEILRNAARAHARLAAWDSGLASLKEAKGLYLSAGRPDGVFWCWVEEGNLHWERRDFEAAEGAYREAEGLAGGEGSDLRKAIVWNNRGLLERSRKRLGSALALFRKARDVFQFLGNPNDLARNTKDLAVTEAAVGRFEAALQLVGELRSQAATFPEASALADEAEVSVRALREGTGPDGFEDVRILREVFEALPPELQVTFVDRGDYKRLMAKTREAVMETQRDDGEAGYLPHLALLTELNHDLLTEEDIGKILSRLMDAAMRLAKAESGFLVLKKDPSAEGAEAGPLPGYGIAVARNVTTQDLQTDVYTFSLSAVRRALFSAQPVVTDNALLDPAFKEARSVHLRQLKSILALPVLDASGKPIGVFYLDHRFEEGLFEGALLEALKAFAGLAALALEKGRMIDSLSRANRDLSDQVSAQVKEIKRNRRLLKNEHSEIIGRSPVMVDVLSVVDTVTDSKIPVWVYGESGTGKEAIARALHVNSARAQGPFVVENCSALPEGLLESELFGHKKGSFTHATADKKGILQYADGGTIFLDEIADMALSLQAKLLRFLQDGDIRPIGATETVRVDVRVVSASNKDLAALVAQGRFREDLFYRLNGITVRLPPLRDRLEDLPLLAEHFLKRIGERDRKTPLRLEPRVLDLFLRYRWPGNIRELQSVLETAALFAEGPAVTLQSLRFKPSLFEGHHLVAQAPPPDLPRQEPLDPILEETLMAIRDNCYHKGYAAAALGISRRALYARLQKFGLKTDVKTLKEQIQRYWSG